MSGIGGAGGIESSVPQQQMETNEKSTEVREVAESIEKATLKPEEGVETERDIKASEELEAAFTTTMDAAQEMATAAQPATVEGSGADQQAEITEKTEEAAEAYTEAAEESVDEAISAMVSAAGSVEQAEGKASVTPAAITLESAPEAGTVTIERAAVAEAAGDQGDVKIDTVPLPESPAARGVTAGVSMEDDEDVQAMDADGLLMQEGDEEPQMRDADGLISQEDDGDVQTMDADGLLMQEGDVEPQMRGSDGLIRQDEEGDIQAMGAGGREAIGTWPTPENPEMIKDSNDGVSAEVIIDSNDTNFAEGGENLAAAEPPTWSNQMDQEERTEYIQSYTGGASEFGLENGHLQEVEELPPSPPGEASTSGNFSDGATDGSIPDQRREEHTRDSGFTEERFSSQPIPGGMEVGSVEPGLEMPEVPDITEDLGTHAIDEPTTLDEVTIGEDEISESSEGAVDEIQEAIDELQEKKIELLNMVARLDLEIMRFEDGGPISSPSFGGGSASLTWLIVIENSDGTFTFGIDGGQTPHTTNWLGEMQKFCKEGIAAMKEGKNTLENAIREIDDDIAALQESMNDEV